MPSVSGLLLAGGEGRRIGSFKAVVPLGGRPLVLRPLRVLRQLTPEVIVACGRREHRRLLEGLVGGGTLVEDEGTGPLGGLHRGARFARGDWLLVAPCDAPFLSPELYRTLLARAEGKDGCLPRLGARDNPTIAVYRREAFLEASEGPLAAGERSLRGVLPRLRLRRLRERDLGRLPYGLACVLDVDTREDLATAEGLLRVAGREDP